MTVAEPEATQRDRWEEQAQQLTNRNPDTSWLATRVTDALRAAYQQGQKDEREACAAYIETHYPTRVSDKQGARWEVPAESDCGKIQSEYAKAIRARAQEETKR